MVNIITDSEVILYADDVTICHSDYNQTIVENKLNADLEIVQEWVDINKLKINVSKTKIMTFTCKKNIQVKIKINNTSIDEVSEYKYLGLLIDKELTFKNHILKLVKTVNRFNGSLNTIKHFLPMNVKRKLYLALVYSHLNKHMISWGGASQSALYPLNVSVNKVVRKLNNFNISTAEKYKFFNLLNIKQLYQLKLAEIMFKSIKLNKAPLVTGLLNDIRLNHSYYTRRNVAYRLPKIQTEVNRRFFLSNAIKVWTNVPTHLKAIDSIETFKYKLKGMLVNDDFKLLDQV